jgi:hypothetical protein
MNVESGLSCCYKHQRSIQSPYPPSDIMYNAKVYFRTVICFPCGATALLACRLPHCWGFELIFRYITLARTLLGEWSARRRDLYLRIYNIDNRRASMTLAGFEPAIPKSERPQTHALDCTATGIGRIVTGVRNTSILNLLQPSGNFTYHQV